MKRWVGSIFIGIGVLFLINAVPLSPHSNEELEPAIYKELDRLKEELVSEHELQKIKNQLTGHFIRSLQSNAGLASQLSYYQILFNDWAYLEKHSEIIAKITPEDIQKVARKYLDPHNRTVAQLVKRNEKQ